MCPGCITMTCMSNRVHLIHIPILLHKLLLQKHKSAMLSLSLWALTCPSKVNSQHCDTVQAHSLIEQQQLKSQTQTLSSVDLSAAATFCDFKLPVPLSNGLHPYMFEM